MTDTPTAEMSSGDDVAIIKSELLKLIINSAQYRSTFQEDREAPDVVTRPLTRWQPIETAPKDGTTVDLWAKTWVAADDRFIWRRFAEYRWSARRFRKPTSYPTSNVELEIGPGWESDRGMFSGEPFLQHWVATHWMPLPLPPPDQDTR